MKEPLIQIYNCQKDLKLSKSSAKALVRSTLYQLKVSCEEVSIYFVSKKRIAQLHRRFFQDPSSTDCISFPLDEKHLGEVFVCPAVAIQYAQKKKLDPYRETSLYVVHGLLHLFGHGDLEKKERITMRKKEKSCMRHLDEQKIFLSQK